LEGNSANDSPDPTNLMPTFILMRTMNPEQPAKRGTGWSKGPSYAKSIVMTAENDDRGFRVAATPTGRFEL
jgi:hypothetical protein